MTASIRGPGGGFPALFRRWRFLTFPRWGALLKGFAVLGGLLAGGALLVWFVAHRQTPDRQEGEAAATPVRVVEVRRLPFRLEARGHGVVRPVETWQAVANLGGRVVERHPDLESGAVLGKGTLLLVLDPSRYELTVAEARAELNRLSAEALELETETTNTGRLLALERERLALAEKELSRMEKLADAGAVSFSLLDEQRRATLAQGQAVTSLENTLGLLAARRETLKARRDGAESRLARARRDLEDTRFTAPYDLRVSQVEVELHQFVNPGQRLFEADGLAAAEVEARVPHSMMRRLLGGLPPAEPGEETAGSSDRFDLSALEAELEWAGAPGVTWKGRVTRIASGLDPATRAFRVVVRTDESPGDGRHPERPSLQRDMYIRVRISIPNPDPLIVVPAGAVQHGEILLADEENRLERRAVEVAFEQRDLAVIKEGLAPGERVVVDDLPSAPRGIPLEPRRDEALENRIAALAQGEEKP